MTIRQQIAAGLFIAEGYDPTGAAAVVGNFSQESGGDLHSGYIPTSRSDHGSQGIAQWRLARLDALEEFCSGRRLHSGTLAAQIKFAVFELGKAYPELDKALRAGGDLDKLTARVCWEYERPAKASANLSNRIRQAHNVFRDYIGANPAHSPAAEAQAKIILAKKAGETHDAHAGLGVIAGGLLGVFRGTLEIPAPMLSAIGCVIGFAVLYSIFQSEKAKTVAAATVVDLSQTAARMEREAPAMQCAVPTGEAEWLWIESLAIWVRGAHAPPPPPVVQASTDPALIAPADMDALAEKIVTKLLAPVERK
ncbi:phage tail tip lysozyme [Methylocapsa acidiphila]|uniref:phage tail tip lysozyme n=1 Tax=Methylocapsa acidiphila TaxID=133552 RepID=UPI00040267A5|nr:phage tail tip lysozyme [Methylocapsa acidiphila]